VIQVESKGNEGTRVCLLLPASESAPESDTPASVAAKSLSDGGGHVHMVEEKALVSGLAARLIEGTNRRVHVFADPAALDAALQPRESARSRGFRPRDSTMGRASPSPGVG